MVCFGTVGLRAVWGQAPSPACEQALPAAEAQYRDAAYDEALRLVAACLDQGQTSDGQAVAAYRLLALIYLKQDEIERARSAVVNLLGIDPAYTVDPIASPPSFVSLVTIVKRDLQTPEEIRPAEAERGRPSFFRRTGTWMTIGTILVGSGVATVLSLGGGGDAGSEGGGPPPSGPDPLPIPPGTP